MDEDPRCRWSSCRSWLWVPCVKRRVLVSGHWVEERRGDFSFADRHSFSILGIRYIVFISYRYLSELFQELT